MGEKVKLLAGVVALAIVLGGAVFGAATLVQAAQGGDRPAPKELLDELLSRVASRLGVTDDRLREAITESELEMLDEAVDEGRVSPEAADRLRQRIEEGKGVFGLPLRRGQAHLGLRELRAGLRLVVNSAAEALDMEAKDLAAELRQGKTLAQVAEERGVSLDDLESGMLEAAEARLDQAVSDGKLTQERAERILQGLSNRIDEMVTRAVPPGWRCPPSEVAEEPTL